MSKTRRPFQETNEAGIEKLQIGQSAPTFQAPAIVRNKVRTVSLDCFKGKYYLVLLFYPADFTFVCPTEILAFNDRIDDFRKNGCDIVACSTDSVHAHQAWCKMKRDNGGLGKLDIPLMADKTLEIAKSYGVLDASTGTAYRGIFIISPKGKVRSVQINDIAVGRSVNETLRMVKAFQYSDKKGEVCPADWKPGEKGIRVPK